MVPFGILRAGSAHHERIMTGEGYAWRRLISRCVVRSGMSWRSSCCRNAAWCARTLGRLCTQRAWKCFRGPTAPAVSAVGRRFKREWPLPASAATSLPPLIEARRVALHFEGPARLAILEAKFRGISVLLPPLAHAAAGAVDPAWRIEAVAWVPLYHSRLRKRRYPGLRDRRGHGGGPRCTSARRPDSALTCDIAAGRAGASRAGAER